MYEIDSTQYISLKTDSNLKNKITKVVGSERSSRWIEEGSAGREEGITSVVENSPRIAGGYGAKKNILGSLQTVRRGENYYMQRITTVTFSKPIDFSKVKAGFSHTGKYYEYGTSEAYSRLKDLASGAASSGYGSPRIGSVTAYYYNGWQYAGQGAASGATSPVMPIRTGELAQADIAKMSWNWEESSYQNDIADIPRCDVGAMGTFNSTVTSFWDDNRFINRIVGFPFGRTSEDVSGPSDEFYGFRKVDKNGRPVDWQDPGSDWDPNSIMVYYITRVESRQYYTSGNTSYAKRWVSLSHDLIVYASELSEETVPFGYGTDDNYSYQYQDSEILDSNAYYETEGNSVSKSNSQKIIDSFSNGKQVVTLELKVADKVYSIGEELVLRGKNGRYIGGTDDFGRPKKFRIVSTEDVCKSTYSQIITAKEV